MTQRRSKKQPDVQVAEFERRVIIDALGQDHPVGNIPGPGRWLILEYQPTSLFSLKASQATSSVGTTLVIPTPYTIKMALVDAAFRALLTDAECEDLFRLLVNVKVRISPAQAAVITRTFVKIRQESRDDDPLRPYGSNIAYRELVFLRGIWRWAFDLASVNEILAIRLVHLAPHIAYIGKRGSFIRFLRIYRQPELGTDFTQPIELSASWNVPGRAHVRRLDDFGPEADLRILSSFSRAKAKAGTHRLFTETVIPVGVSNSGPGFVEYRRE